MYLIFKILIYNHSCIQHTTIHASAQRCGSVIQPYLWDIIVFLYYYDYYYTLKNISLLELWQLAEIIPPA